MFEQSTGLLLDCTLGYAGHSSALLEQNDSVDLIACDRDDEAICFSSQRLLKFKDRARIVKSPFSEVFSHILDGETRKIRGILADIGVSSLQLDKNERGFSLNSDSLDMRMDACNGVSAADIVADYSKEELERIFRDYGELTNASKIAQKIVQERLKSPITSAKQLRDILSEFRVFGRSVSVPTLVFQALRIEVNDELGELRRLLKAIQERAKDGLLSNCLVAIISFHSLEDRMVKEAFKSWARDCVCPSELMRCECGKNHSLGEIITKKPLTASQDEIRLNSRSKSAKLRVFKIR
ncbi:ribosomal RNA small subunit methyltransferase H [Campylobacter sp. 19-13652]|nr:ribosomal RNA small subunit methyltransferase H [Campylobacter sp. 19-13652]